MPKKKTKNRGKSVATGRARAGNPRKNEGTVHRANVGKKPKLVARPRPAEEVLKDWPLGDMGGGELPDEFDGLQLYGPRDVAAQLVAGSELEGMSVALAVIASIRLHLGRVRKLIARLGSLAGDRDEGIRLLDETAVALGVEGEVALGEDRQRGKPLCVPMGGILAVRGLLGHFYPGLEERDSWPASIAEVHGLTSADVLLGPLPREFAYERSLQLLDWARDGMDAIPEVEGLQPDEVEEEFRRPYRQTIVVAVRYFLLRLVSWVETHVSAFEGLAVPIVQLTRDGVEVTVAGVTERRPLGDAVEEFLRDLLDNGAERCAPKNKLGLLKRIPELRPFIKVEDTRDAGGLPLYKLHDVVRRASGAL